MFSVEIKDDVKKEEFFNKLPRKMAILRPDPQKYSAISKFFLYNLLLEEAKLLYKLIKLSNVIF